MRQRQIPSLTVFNAYKETTMLLTLAWKTLYLAWVLSEFLILLGTRRRAAEATSHDRGSLRILWLVLAASIFAGSWYGGTHLQTIAPGASWPYPASVLLLASGLSIRWAAVLSLGRSFTASVSIHAGQTLYCRGLFHLVRHPSYTGLLLVFLALGLHTRSWVGLVILIVPTTAALLHRIRIEEEALSAAFGAKYAAYSANTRRLIPGIY